MLSYLNQVLGLIADYPHLVYGLVFFAALSEAVPVVGAVIPGSMMIIGLAALVPTGAVGLWPMLGWAWRAPSSATACPTGRAGAITGRS